jgi:hypothetical protein
MSIINFATMKSEWMRHLYQPEHGGFRHGDAPLAKALRDHAVKANPAIEALGRQLVALDSEYAARMPPHSALAVKAAHKAKEIDALVEEMLIKKIDAYTWDEPGLLFEAQVAGLKADLLDKASALDRAYVAFEKGFFATEKGAKFKGYIEAMKAGDFATCNAGLKAEEAAEAALLKSPTLKPPKPNDSAPKAVITERALLIKDGSLFKQMMRVMGWSGREMSKHSSSDNKER